MFLLRMYKCVFLAHRHFFQGGRRCRFFKLTQPGRYCHTAVFFRRVAVFSFLAVTTLAEPVNENMAVFFRWQCNTAVIFWPWVVSRFSAVTTLGEAVNQNRAVFFRR